MILIRSGVIAIEMILLLAFSSVVRAQALAPEPALAPANPLGLARTLFAQSPATGQQQQPSVSSSIAILPQTDVNSFQSYDELLPQGWGTTGDRSGPPLPVMVLTAAISASEQQTLTEDLQVMQALLSKATGILSGPEASQNTALGVTVHRGMDQSSIEYVQDVGVMFRSHTMGVSFAPQEQSAFDKPKSEEPQESDWDAARRELFQPTAAAVGLEWSEVRGTRKTALKYNPQMVAAIRERIEQVLGNIGRIHFPASANGKRQSVTVYLSCGSDGSVMTIRRAVTPQPDAAGVLPEESTATFQYFDPAVAASAQSRPNYFPRSFIGGNPANVGSLFRPIMALPPATPAGVATDAPVAAPAELQPRTRN